MATKQDYNNTADGGYPFTIGNLNKIGQVFTANSAYSLSSFKLQFRYLIYEEISYSVTSGTVTGYIYNVSGGKPTTSIATSNTLDATIITSEFTNFEFTFSSPPSLESGVQYAVVIDADGLTFENPGTSVFFVNASTSNPYAGGSCGSAIGSWTMQPTKDLWFETYGDLLIPEKAVTPEPGDTTTGWTNEWPTLTWVDGGDGEPNAATGYDVYFGTLSLSRVSSNQAGTSFSLSDYVGDLELLTVYQWRIDSINAGGTTTGDVWTFTTSGVAGLGIARDPVPSNGATGQSVNLAALSFGDGDGAITYNVYFGTPGNLSLLESVSYASQSASLAFQSLSANTTYNWRVDSVGSLGTLTGTTWAFTTTADFSPPDPSTSGNGAFVTLRKLVAASANSFWYEDN